MDIHKGGGNAVLGQCMGQQVVRAAIKGALGDNVLSCLGQRLDRVGNGGCARRPPPGRRFPPPRQLFAHPAPLGWRWSVGRRCCLVPPDGTEPPRGRRCERHRMWSDKWAPPGVRGWVGRFLARMELQGFKAMERNMGHFASPLFVVSIWKDAFPDNEKVREDSKLPDRKKRRLPHRSGKKRRHAKQPGPLFCPGVQHSSTAKIGSQQGIEMKPHVLPSFLISLFLWDFMVCIIAFL